MRYWMALYVVVMAPGAICGSVSMLDMFRNVKFPTTSRATCKENTGS